MGILVASCQSHSKESYQKRIDKVMKKVSASYDKDSLDPQLAKKAADLQKMYIRKFPDDSAHLPKYYYNATQLYTDAKMYDTSLVLINSFLTKYPESRMAPFMLFYKGYFIYDQGMHDLPKAKETYEEFLKKYPENEDYTKTVLFSLEHLGQSNQKILNEIIKGKGIQDSLKAK